MIRTDGKPTIAWAKFEDPFSGKCIHGVPGAKILRGKLTNPRCSSCWEKENR